MLLDGGAAENLVPQTAQNLMNTLSFAVPCLPVRTNSKKFFSAVVGLSLVMLSGCSSGLSQERACEEINLYAGEISHSLGNVTDSIDETSMRRLYADNMISIAKEAQELGIADSEIQETTIEWAESIETVARHLKEPDNIFKQRGYYKIINPEIARMENLAIRLDRLCS